MKPILAIIITAMLAGCASNTRVCDVGRYEVREIATHNMLAANVTALVAVDDEGNIVPVGSGGQEGIVWSAAQIGALIHIGSQIGNIADPTVKLER